VEPTRRDAHSLRGGKGDVLKGDVLEGDVLEGGVRVPAMGWWPSMIEPAQEPVVIIHVTGLFTTAARLGSALDKVPTDRVTDGVDQTSLLLLGEGHGRRNVMFHYSGGVLGALRYEDFKDHITEGHGGLPGMDFYNAKRDPGEKFGQLYPGLFAVTPIQTLLRDHMLPIQKFPHGLSEVPPEGVELTPHD
jgi:arylsulfatase